MKESYNEGLASHIGPESPVCVRHAQAGEKHRQFVAVCELCAPQDFMAAYSWIGNGCPPSDRLALCKAFIAKAVWSGIGVSP